MNAAAEATAAEPGLKPADPDPAAGAIALNRSELNRCRPERAARSRGKTRRLAGAEAAAEGRARRAHHRVRLHFICYQIPSNTTT